MRPPTSFYRFLIRGAALTTLTLSTLPISAQKQTTPGDWSSFLAPDPLTRLVRSARSHNQLEAQKYWRLMHGGRNSKSNSKALARSRARMAHGQPAGKFGARKSMGQTIVGIGTPIGDGNGQTGPTLPTPSSDQGWQFIGPINFGAHANTFLQSGLGLANVSGRINAAAYDPKNPNTIYIASASGGIWKTVNGGQSWTPLTDNLVGSPTNATGLVTNSFSSVTVDPNNSSVIYAGSGDYDDGYSLGYGLFKSTNGGTTWTQLNNLPSGQHTIRKVLVDPNNSQHVLVALGRDTDPGSIAIYALGLGGTPPESSIYQTLDGGQTWADVQDFPGPPGPNIPFPGYVSNLVYNKDNTALYASVDFAGVYKSIDNGTTWFGPIGGGVAVAPPPPIIPTATLESSGVPTARVDVATSPTDPNTLYVLSEAYQAVYMSKDGGATWADVSGNLNTSYGFGSNDSAWIQGWYDFYLTAAPATFYIGGRGAEGGPPLGPKTVDVLYVGLLGIYQTTDPGDPVPNWVSITDTYTGNDTTHTDQHAFVVNPKNPNIGLALNDGGIYQTLYNPDSNVVSFTGLNNALGITQLYSSDMDPYDVTNSLIASQDNSVGHADFDLTTWTINTGGDGVASLYSRTAPYVQYTASANGQQFVEENNDWQLDPFSTTTFYSTLPPPKAPATELIGFVLPLATTANSQFLISGGQHFYIYNHGATVYPAAGGAWTLGAALTIPTSSDYCTAVGASPANQNIVYAGMASGNLFYSPDQGGSAIEIDAQASAFGLPPLPVTDIKGGYKNVNRVYATFGTNEVAGVPRIYRCDDITAQTPVWIAIDGSAGGTSPLPEVAINSLAIPPHDDEQELIVGTDIGVFISHDGGDTWSSLNTVPGTTGTLPNVVINKVTYDPSTGILDAATYGRGLWRASLTSEMGPMQVRATLPGYKGNKSKLNARVDLFPVALIDDLTPGTFEEPTAVGYPPAGAGVGTPLPYKYLLNPTESRFGKLTPAGIFTTEISSIGNFDVLITVDHYLRKRLKNINTTRIPLITGNLKLGDAAGPINAATGFYGPPDNVIDLNDYYAYVDLGVGYLTLEAEGLVSKYNNGPLDLNGDGVVDTKDLNIVVAFLIANGVTQGD